MTLIEVLVAIAILALISIVVFGGFSQTMTNKRVLEEQADQTHVIRIAMERMVRELSMAYVSAHQNVSPMLQMMNTCFIGGRSGRAHRIDFTSFSHRRLYRDAHESDQNELSYFVTDHPDPPPDRNGRRRSQYVLVRREQNRIDQDPQQGGTMQILVEDVVDFEMEYFDTVSGEWVEQWDTRDVSHQPMRLPAQVKIRLTVHDDRARSGQRTFATRAQPMIVWGVNHGVYQQ
jgi:general secretion pathway protein J